MRMTKAVKHLRDMRDWKADKAARKVAEIGEAFKTMGAWNWYQAEIAALNLAIDLMEDEIEARNAEVVNSDQ